MYEQDKKIYDDNFVDCSIKVSLNGGHEELLLSDSFDIERKIDEILDLVNDTDKLAVMN